MNTKSILIFIAVIAVGILGLFLLTQISDNFYTYQGSVIDPPMEAFDFSLAYDGGEFQLSEQAGKVVLMFFGYTNCPDFCPTTLAEFNQVYNALGEYQNDVVFVYITVDPDRDTPEKMLEYARAFNPAFIGLSGTPDELDPIHEAYYVYYEISDAESASGYLVDHSTRTIVIDQFGNFRMTFPYGIGDEAMVDDLIHLLKEKE